MKKYYFIYIIVAALFAVAVSCDNTEEFLYSHKRTTVRMYGYNGSDDFLTVKVDTSRFTQYPLSTWYSFDQIGALDVSRYSAGSSLKVVVSKEESGEVIFQKDIPVGTPLEEIKLYYLQGKVYTEIPTAEPREGYTLTSYFLNADYSRNGNDMGTKYNDEIDVVFYKIVQHTTPELNWRWAIDSEEEIGRLSGMQPNTFSQFVEVPKVDQTVKRTTNENNQVIRQDQTVMKVRAYKAGTTIPYYEAAGFTVDREFDFPYNYNAKPTVLLLNEQAMEYDGVKYYEPFGRYDIIELH